MKMRGFFSTFLFPAILAITFSGCDNSSTQASGPGSETTNGIFATILTEEGIPAHTIGAALRKTDFTVRDSSQAAISADYFSDSAGLLEINAIEPGEYRLTVVSDSLIFSQEIFITDSLTDLGQIILKKPGNISGTIANQEDPEKAEWIGVYGLDILSRIDSNGHFVLHGLPAGSLKLYALNESRLSIIADTLLSIQSATTTEWIHISRTPTDTLPADTLQPDTSFQDTVAQDSSVQILWESFEDSVSFAEKAWYFSKDSASLATISFPADSAWKGVVENADRQGKVFSGYYSSSPLMQNNNYVIFGSRISAEGVDLSGLDSVTFFAKGTGSLRFALERWNNSASDNLKAWTADIPLSNTWSRYSIKPSDFLQPQDDSLSTGWESVRTTVTRIHFFGINGQELSLDDIVFYGTHLP